MDAELERATLRFRASSISSLSSILTSILVGFLLSISGFKILFHFFWFYWNGNLFTDCEI